MQGWGAWVQRSPCLDLQMPPNAKLPVTLDVPLHRSSLAGRVLVLVLVLELELALVL